MDPRYRDKARNLIYSNIMKAMLDLNIIYLSKYYDVLHIEHGFYGKYVIGDYVDQIKKSMSKRDLFNYWLF